MSDADQAALAALREATRALRIGEDVAQDTPAPGTHGDDVAVAVAALLEAASLLLRRTDHEAVTSDDIDDGLRAVARHLDAGAQLAHRHARGAGSNRAAPDGE